MQKETGSFWGFCRLSGAAPALEGTTVRLSSSLTLHRAPEGSKSWIVTRRRPREPLTLSCEPIGDRVAVLGEPWISDRGPLERHRRTQPRELDQVSYIVSESDCDTQENMKNKQSNSILNTKTIKYYPKIKCSATDQVIYSAMVGTVNIVMLNTVGCEVRKEKEKEKELHHKEGARRGSGCQGRGPRRRRGRGRGRGQDGIGI